MHADRKKDREMKQTDEHTKRRIDRARFYINLKKAASQIFDFTTYS